jgi:hypothetical protein
MTTLRGTLAANVTGNIPERFWPDEESACLYRKEITLLAAPSKVGKSQMSLRIAADFTIDGNEDGTGGFVIYCNLEDALPIQRYRFEAAGADMDKVLFTTFALGSELRILEDHIQHYGAGLIVFDTAVKHLTRGGRRIPESQWGTVLTDLREVCQRNDCAALLIHHTKKGVAKSADWRDAVAGQVGHLTGTARAIALGGKRPDDPTQVVYCPVGDSYAEAPLAVSFTWHEADFTQADGKQVTVSYLKVADTGIEIPNPTLLVHITGEDVKRGPTAEQAAAAGEFIIGALANGPMPVDDHDVCTCGTVVRLGDACSCGGVTTSRFGLKSLAEDDDVSWGTLKRAKASSAFNFIENGRKGFGKGSLPYWKLPDGHPALAAGAPSTL